MQMQFKYSTMLTQISEWFNIPIFALEIINPNPITARGICKIPGYIRDSYTVKKFDSIDGLARKCGVRPEAILLLNQMEQEILREGETIEIPRQVKSSIVNPHFGYDHSRVEQDIHTLYEMYSMFQVRVIGESEQGRSITEITIGNGPLHVHLNASFHGNEWVTTNVVMQFVQDYVHAIATGGHLYGIPAETLYTECTLSVVPMVNPDGVEIAQYGPHDEERPVYRSMLLHEGVTFQDWKANARGVDLNNQFPTNWEIEKNRKWAKIPAYRDYPGAAPLTEKEAIVMQKLVEEKQFHRVVALHTQGKEFYWGYEGIEPKVSALLAARFERASGYKAVQMIDSHAGFKDWFIATYEKPGFTIELGEGVNPLPIEQFESIYRDVIGILVEAIRPL